MALPSFVMTQDEFRKLCHDHANRLGLGGTEEDAAWLADLPIEKRDEEIDAWLKSGIRPTIKLVDGGQG